jgi:hypothetical protein
MVSFEVRRSDFEAWQPAPLEQVLGKGRYATVYRCGLGAAKVLDLAGKSRDARRQAYREHVVAVLQSLLLLEEVTPHVPFHYGATTSVHAGSLGFVLFLERFDGSLLDLGQELLVRSADWVQLAMQLLHASLALALLFGVVHNDLYARNVLVRRLPRPSGITYDVEGALYHTALGFLAVVTDYGIASGTLVGAATEPEVARASQRQKQPRPKAGFAFVPPRAHILHHDPPLPPFCRDPFTILKCLTYGQRGLPNPPLPIRLWSAEAMTHVDARLVEFAEAAAQEQLFHHLFHPENLARFQLELPEGEGGRRFSLRRGCRERLLEQATRSLERLREEDAWLHSGNEMNK